MLDNPEVIDFATLCAKCGEPLFSSKCWHSPAPATPSECACYCGRCDRSGCACPCDDHPAPVTPSARPDDETFDRWCREDRSLVEDEARRARESEAALLSDGHDKDLCDKNQAALRDRWFEENARARRNAEEIDRLRAALDAAKKDIETLTRQKWEERKVAEEWMNERDAAREEYSLLYEVIRSLLPDHAKADRYVDHEITYTRKRLAQ